MITNRPILVAVGGDSGTGKTTLVSGLYRIFGSERITNICLDDYHKLDRAGRKKARVTALNPRANDLDLMVDHVNRLRRGETITKPTYDHATGTFGPAETVAPREIVVIRGLFPLFTAELNAAFDVRIWLDPQEELKWSWKVKRDCAQRGYSVPEVIRQLMDRRDDQLAFIAPQKKHADATSCPVRPSTMTMPTWMCESTFTSDCQGSISTMSSQQARTPRGPLSGSGTAPRRRRPTVVGSRHSRWTERYRHVWPTISTSASGHTWKPTVTCGRTGSATISMVRHLAVPSRSR